MLFPDSKDWPETLRMRWLQSFVEGKELCKYQLETSRCLAQWFQCCKCNKWRVTRVIDILQCKLSKTMTCNDAVRNKHEPILKCGNETEKISPNGLHFDKMDLKALDYQRNRKILTDEICNFQKSSSLVRNLTVNMHINTKKPDEHFSNSTKNKNDNNNSISKFSKRSNIVKSER